MRAQSSVRSVFVEGAFAAPRQRGLADGWDNNIEEVGFALCVDNRLRPVPLDPARVKGGPNWPPSMA